MWPPNNELYNLQTRMLRVCACCLSCWMLCYMLCGMRMLAVLHRTLSVEEFHE